jgi:uracil-DNA glycosylase
MTLTEEYWIDRGVPWEFDRGPVKKGPWPTLFAETPNYRGLGLAWQGEEAFRWHFGPMFYRGRIRGGARVLVVGQEGAQDESLTHRSFTGETGGRIQYVLNHLGITRSYLFLNTFVYPIFGQYGAPLRPLAQDLRSPIAQHRQALFDLALSEHDLRLVIAVGTAAKESVATWVRSKGGAADPDRLHEAEGHRIRSGLRIVGVRHPGGVTKGTTVATITADIAASLSHVDGWMAADPNWLVTDADGEHKPADAYTYSSAPIPFRDLPFGVPWRLGYGSTTSNRRDRQSAIQIFSAAGIYDNRGQVVTYAPLDAGTIDGYLPGTGDLAYEPSRHAVTEFDGGPLASMPRLLQGGEAAFPWPDFAALGLPGHPSFGHGPVLRGRLASPSILALADQTSADDLFTGRALSGEAGQRLQGFLRAAGVDRHYAIVRPLPVDALGAPAAVVDRALDDAKVRSLLREVIRRSNPSVVLGVGPGASRIAGSVAGTRPVVTMGAWDGALDDWRRALAELATVPYPRDRVATFEWDGSRRQIPRLDLPYGTLGWQGTSGDRAANGLVDGAPSPDYVKLTMPKWAAALTPEPLSVSERAALDSLRT